MPIINVTLPSDNTDADVADYNDPINDILAVVNGNLDDDNIASLSGTKIVGGTLPVSALNDAAKEGWVDGISAPNTITHNGMREFDLVFNSTDLTGKLSKGMRVRTTRSTAAPDQSAALVSASSHSFSRASASLAGLSFTDDFSIIGWIKRTAHGATESIISRYDGTNGWNCRITPFGQVELFGNNGGGANYRRITTNTAIPLDEWVHFAITLDMSGDTGTAYINGISVQAYTDSGGTNPTSLLQGSGDLEIGSRNGGEYWDGSIAQIGIFSSIISASDVREHMAHGLTGTESGLVSAYSLDNDITDLNSNGNDLTANNGAVATSNSSPFCNDGASTTLDYAYIKDVVFSTNTTVTVKAGKNNHMPTDGASAFLYSPHEAPFGYPPEEIMNGWEWFDPYWGFHVLGAADLFGKRRIKGKTCEFYVEYIRSGTSSIDNGFGFDPEASGMKPSADFLLFTGRFGFCQYYDDSTNRAYVGCMTATATDRFRPNINRVDSTYAYASTVSSTLPVTDATGDFVQMRGTFELEQPQ